MLPIDAPDFDLTIIRAPMVIDSTKPMGSNTLDNSCKSQIQSHCFEPTKAQASAMITNFTTKSFLVRLNEATRQFAQPDVVQCLQT